MKYITFKQAKWLKKKGHEIDTDEVLFCIDEINNIREHQIKNRDIIYNGGIGHVVKENEYRIYEQHQVVDWLLEKHGIWVEVRRTSHFGEIRFQAYYNEKPVTGTLGGYLSCRTPQEAYSSAFDHIMKNVLGLQNSHLYI